jgi:hypothetical protein
VFEDVEILFQVTLAAGYAEQVEIEGKGWEHWEGSQFELAFEMECKRSELTAALQATDAGAAS